MKTNNKNLIKHFASISMVALMASFASISSKCNVKITPVKKLENGTFVKADPIYAQSFNETKCPITDEYGVIETSKGFAHGSVSYDTTSANRKFKITLEKMPTLPNNQRYVISVHRNDETNRYFYECEANGSDTYTATGNFKRGYGIKEVHIYRVDKNKPKEAIESKNFVGKFKTFNIKYINLTESTTVIDTIYDDKNNIIPNASVSIMPYCAPEPYIEIDLNKALSKIDHKDPIVAVVYGFDPSKPDPENPNSNPYPDLNATTYTGKDDLASLVQTGKINAAIKDDLSATKSYKVSVYQKAVNDYKFLFKFYFEAPKIMEAYKSEAPKLTLLSNLNN